VAAEVKNSEPAKNTAASAAAPTSWTKPGNGPTAKHAEPTMNSTALHRVVLRNLQLAVWVIGPISPARLAPRITRSR
jgi:hypothetical protein